MQLESGGWAARCEACDRLEYPRQDPAIIVLVQDHDGRVLLAHNALWKPGFVSIIAGYVEAPPGGAFNFNIYSVNVNAMDRSFSCCGSTISGAPDIGSPAFCTFGNAMTSRMESFFSISITMRSRP